LATLYERYNAGEDSTGYCYGVRRYAQTFTVGTVGANVNHNISYVKMLFYRQASQTSYFEIQGVDGSSKPDGVVHSQAIVVDAGAAAPAAWVKIDMPSYLLLANTQYALVHYNDGDGNVTGGIVWSRDNSGSYGGGSMVYSSDSGGSWTVYAARDMMFEIWGDIPVTGATGNLNLLLGCGGNNGARIPQIAPHTMGLPRPRTRIH